MAFDDPGTDGRRCPHCFRLMEDCGEDTMCIRSPPGTRVWFLNANGHEWERATAAKVLATDVVYEVAKVDPRSWTTRISLQGVDGWFNSVMFGRDPPQ